MKAKVKCAQKANNRVQLVQLEFTEAKANLLERGKVNLLKQLNSATFVMKIDQNKKLKGLKRNYDGSLSAMESIVRDHEPKK